jgi:signal transduction histidine kinase
MPSGASRRTVVVVTVDPVPESGLARPSWDRHSSIDAVIAVMVATIQVSATYAAATHQGRSISVLGYLLLAVAGLVLVARRRFPVTVLVLSYAASILYWSTNDLRGLIFLADIVAFMTVVLARKREVAVVALVGYYVGYLWLPVLAGTHRAPSSAVAIGAATGLTALLGVAELLRLRRQRSEAVNRGREEAARRRISEERMRIARELHDVVAHNISVINVQANSALHLMDRQPERARSALTTINEVSKQALVELRSVLGVLRQVDVDAPLSPSPSLERLDELAAAISSAGFSVEVEKAGAAGSLPASIDLAAYRIIQEALTNAVRHSGGSHAFVHLDRDEHALMVQIDDDGRNTKRGGSSGNGIVGMTERARALCGTLEAGPTADGGFRVRAWLPLSGATP